MNVTTLASTIAILGLLIPILIFVIKMKSSCGKRREQCIVDFVNDNVFKNSIKNTEKTINNTKELLQTEISSVKSHVSEIAGKVKEVDDKVNKVDKVTSVMDVKLDALKSSLDSSQKMMMDYIKKVNGKKK